MQISEILSTDRICFDSNGTSKKAALETLANLIAKDSSEFTQGEVFNSLLTRERLGSTGLGLGAAIPHGRHNHDNKTLGAFIRMQTPVDYDADDKQPVDILFALLVPQESTDEHLQILSRLAEKFSDTELLNKLRTEKSAEAIYKLLAE
jgi:PTS system nitrogen regulatory IIA component